MQKSTERPIRIALSCLALTALVIGGACRGPVAATPGSSPAPGEAGRSGTGPEPGGEAIQKGGSERIEPPKAEAGSEAAGTVTVSGLLKSGYVGIGGEHTGWMLLPPGKKGEGIEVDLGKVMTQARQLDGRLVTITGRMIEKSRVERGKFRLLVADSLSAGPN